MVHYMALAGTGEAASGCRLAMEQQEVVDSRMELYKVDKHFLANNYSRCRPCMVTETVHVFWPF